MLDTELDNGYKTGGMLNKIEDDTEMKPTGQGVDQNGNTVTFFEATDPEDDDQIVNVKMNADLEYNHLDNQNDNSEDDFP